MSHPHTHTTNVAAFVPFVVEGTDVRRSWEPASVRRADKQRGRGRFHTWALNCWRHVPRADSVDQAPGEASRSRRRKGDLDYFLTVLALTCRQNLFRAPRAGYHFRNGGGTGFVLGAEGCWSSGGGAMGQTCFLHLTFARVGPRAPNQGRCDLVLLTGSQTPPPPWGLELVLRLCSSNLCRGTLRAAMGVGEGQLPASLLPPQTHASKHHFQSAFVSFIDLYLGEGLI